MNNISLTVIKATATKKGDGFITKLQNKQDKSVTTAFGKKTATTQVTYYAKFDEQKPAGFTAELDLDMFRVEERPYEIPEGENKGVTIMNKWLHIK